MSSKIRSAGNTEDQIRYKLTNPEGWFRCTLLAIFVRYRQKNVCTVTQHFLCFSALLLGYDALK